MLSRGPPEASLSRLLEQVVGNIPRARVSQTVIARLLLYPFRAPIPEDTGTRSTPDIVMSDIPTPRLTCHRADVGSRSQGTPTNSLPQAQVYAHRSDNTAHRGPGTHAHRSSPGPVTRSEPHFTRRRIPPLPRRDETRTGKYHIIGLRSHATAARKTPVHPDAFPLDDLSKKGRRWRLPLLTFPIRK